MDIPVSRLNQRMALQLPAELPLGLVFVVGQVRMPGAAEAGLPGDFYLGDNEYRLPCRLSERAAAEVRLGEGDKVRAGGHLVFEPARASYYLLARDVEHLDSLRPAVKPLTAIIADNNRRGQAASLTQAKLPTWVQQMAPPEIQPQTNDQSFAASLAGPAPGAGGDWELLADAQAAMAFPAAEPVLAGLSDDLIAFLSQAMDSEVEVEITSEIMTDLNTTGTTDLLPPELLEALDDIETTVNNPSTSPAPQATLLDMPAAQTDESRPPVEQSESLATSLALMESLLALEQAAKIHSAPPAGVAETEQRSETVDALETGGSAGPVTAPEAVSEPVELQADPKSAQSGSQSQAGTAAKRPRRIPWYVVLLVIILFVMLLLAVGFALVFPQSIPVDLPLYLPAELPFGS
jgi:hypothetical protein